MGMRRRKEEITLFLGNGCSLDGDLSFTGTARLDGVFKGDIRGQGTLMVGPTAEVEADINVTAVVISGTVIGNVVATDRLEVRAPGQIQGDISAPLVVIDEGVVFEGHCRMAKGEITAEPAKVAFLTAPSGEVG